MRVMAFTPIVLVIFLCVSSAGAVDLITDDGELIKTAWIEYSPSNTRFPHCCVNERDCKMVRLSPEFYKQTSKGKLRHSLSDPKGRMDLIVTYNKELDGFKGKVRRNGVVYNLEPVSLEERKRSPCFVERLKNSKFVYHRYKIDSNVYAGVDTFRILFDALLSPPMDRTCCSSSEFCHGVNSVNIEILKKKPTGHYDLYIPRHDQPATDMSEFFQLKATQPSPCLDSLCDVYIFKNLQDELLTITVDSVGLELKLEGKGSTIKVLQRCKGEYVWTTGPPKGYAGYYHEIRALPGPDCWFPEDYCDPLHFTVDYEQLDIEGKTTDDLVMECYESFQQTSKPNVNYFTYFETRYDGICYLLSDCLKIKDDICLEKKHCVSGPADCGPLPDNANCTGPLDLGDTYTKWQCIDKRTNKLGPVHQEGDLLPGTICLQSCGSWRQIAQDGEPEAIGYLQSRCMNSGEWSPTATLNGDPRLAYPAPPYPKPDITLNSTDLPLTCGCMPFPITYNGSPYNPDDEDAADFECNSPLIPSGPGGLLTIETTNVCYLWCDSILAVTVRCLQDEWTGNPERGLWCYDAPNIGCATVFEDFYYGGRTVNLLPGEEFPCLTSVGFKDLISSVQISPGCTLTAYENCDYEGLETSYTENTPLISGAKKYIASLKCSCIV